MSRNNHWLDPRNEYGERSSEYGGGEHGGAGRNGNGGGGYNGGGGPEQYVSTRVTLQVGVGRSEPDPRMQHDGSGSERCGERGGGQSGKGHVRGGDEDQYAQRHERSDEREHDRRRERDGSSDYERDYGRGYRDHGEYGGGGDDGWRRGHGGGGYDRGGSSRGDRFLNDARKNAWRKPSSVNATGAATGAEAAQNVIRFVHLENVTRVNGEVREGTLHARVHTTLVESRMALPGAGEMPVQLSAEETAVVARIEVDAARSRASAGARVEVGGRPVHREQSAPEPARGERGRTQGDVWTGPVPQGASDDAVIVQRERIRGLIFRAKTTGQGLFGLLDDDLMGQVWHFVEEDEWTYKGVLRAAKEQPRLWMTLDDLATTTLGALRQCAGRTMQTHSVGRLVRRAATYGWLPRLARDIDEEVGAQRYVEILDEFRMIVRRRDMGDVSKRADKVMNQFDSILRPGMARRFSRAAPAIALLREAVERGWKLKLARDVAAMAGTAVESDSDDDLPNMS